jgi:8-oxo-dGTP pyrophosphatase MutT (NUDIX family)
MSESDVSKIEFKNFPAQTMDGKPATITIASGPVIIHEGKVLLILDNDPFYKFPGGSEHDDESHIDTAVREGKEETGLDLEIIGKPFGFAFHKVTEDGTTKYYTLLHYLTQITTDSSDIKSALKNNPNLGLFDLNSLPDNIAPNVMPVIKHFMTEYPELFNNS